jgi:pseudouridine synthase
VTTEQKRPLKTLERVLSKAGLGSRSQARSWIHAGRVTVNGQPTQNPDQWVDPVLDDVRFDTKPLPRHEPRYILLHKPIGYLTTRRDPDGRATVFDLIGGVEQVVSYVGRLDLDTSGLLLLTNDNTLAEHVTNPEHHVPKTYLVEASPSLSDDQLQQLRDGISLDDGPTRPADVRRLRLDASLPDCCFEITITEGRNRQVRRMVEALGAQVRTLVRTCIGPIQLGDLPVGSWRDLTPDEVRALQHRDAQPSAIR